MRRFVGLPVLALLALAVPAAAQSDYPSRGIKIIVAVPAGGGVDVTARVPADQLQKKWSHPVTVENHTGAGGNIGTEAVYVSPPDGYTLLATHLCCSPPTPHSTRSCLTIRAGSSQLR